VLVDAAPLQLGLVTSLSPFCVTLSLVAVLRRVREQGTPVLAGWLTAVVLADVADERTLVLNADQSRQQKRAPPTFNCGRVSGPIVQVRPAPALVRGLRSLS
jgi:hypothetical protein